MQVIVEGVETPQQLEIIRRIGGNEVQGFLLGRPTADPASQLASGSGPMDVASLDQHADYLGGTS
jgi:EAL domain-containing protein (putative c-di-GMP-specific phosphodiesterase class I)